MGRVLLLVVFDILFADLNVPLWVDVSLLDCDVRGAKFSLSVS